LKITRKYLFAIFIIIGVSLSNCSSNSTSNSSSSYPQTIDQLGEFALAAFAANDFNKYSQLLSTKADMEWLVGVIISGIKASGLSPNSMASKINSVQSGFARGIVIKQQKKEFDYLEKMFPLVHKEGKAAGLDWTKATFSKSIVSQSRTEYGVKTAFVYLIIKDNGQEYKIKIDVVMKSKRGWVIRDFPRWVGKVKL